MPEMLYLPSIGWMEVSAMRGILIASVAALALTACEQKAADNHATAKAAAPTVQATNDRKIIASFNCDAARGQAQELVCADANLAAMDREAARLGASDAAGQAVWASERDACGKADELRLCVMANAALRIHHLRSVSPGVAKRFRGDFGRAGRVPL